MLSVGAIRFEAAAESEQDDSLPSSSDFGSDSDLESYSGSEGFSFSDTDSDVDLPHEKEGGDETVNAIESNGTVDIEDLECPGGVQKRRWVTSHGSEKGTTAVATLRRQAAKRES